jgi:anaerobic magnesium-protoporphyrin IX monomethyl ester cyclase
MIILFHPRAVKPKNRRFPLAILSVAAALEGKEDYVIVDGNLDTDPAGSIARISAESRVELLAVSVMPGPQMVAALPVCREFRQSHPEVPIAWGGYFPSLYTDAALNARYVDFAIRGQGEDTLVELIAALRKERKLETVSGLSFKDAFGLHVHNTDRTLRSPSDFPPLPYHRLRNVDRYLLPTFLGTRTAVHQASIGCPFRCKFCGVVPIFDGKQKM